MVVITENIINGKLFPGKDKEFRFGHISFKLKDIKLTERQPSGTTGERCRTIRWRERRQIGNRKDRPRTTSGIMVRDAKQFNGRQTTQKRQTGTQLPSTPRKDTQQGKGGGCKTTVKVQLSEKLGKGSISQTKVLRSKASVTIPKAVFFSRKVLSCFCFKWLLYESLLMGYEYKCNIMAKVTWEKCALQLSSNEHRHLIKWPHFQKCWTSCPISLYNFSKVLGTHTLADIAETPAESRGWSEVQKAHAPHLLARMTNKPCLSASFSPLHLWKS